MCLWKAENFCERKEIRKDNQNEIYNILLERPKDIKTQNAHPEKRAKESYENAKTEYLMKNSASKNKMHHRKKYINHQK